jgi:transposase-like protein
MKIKRRSWTDEDRALVFNLYDNHCKSLTDVAFLVNRPLSSVSSLIRDRRNGTVRAPCAGRQRVPAERREIVIAMARKGVEHRVIASELGISTNTIWKILTDARKQKRIGWHPRTQHAAVGRKRTKRAASSVVSPNALEMEVDVARSNVAARLREGHVRDLFDSPAPQPSAGKSHFIRVAPEPEPLWSPLRLRIARTEYPAPAERFAGRIDRAA